MKSSNSTKSPGAPQRKIQKPRLEAVRAKRPPAPPAGVLQPARTDPGAEDVRNRLIRAGASRSLTEAVVGRVLESGATGAWAIDAAAKIIGGLFRVHASPRRARSTREPHLLVFVGPTGAGKTTVLAKLGRKLTQAGRSVRYASLDPLGITALQAVGGVDADVDRSELPITAARNGADVKRLLRGSPGTDVVLLDTPGLSPRDATGLAALARELARIGRGDRSETYLVLPANASRASLELCIRGFSAISVDATVITKLDETEETAAPLELSLRSGSAIAFLAEGQDVRAGLFRPRPGHFADLLLSGHIR